MHQMSFDDYFEKLEGFNKLAELIKKKIFNVQEPTNGDAQNSNGSTDRKIYEELNVLADR